MQFAKRGGGVQSRRYSQEGGQPGSLQGGFPLTSRPFLEVAERLGMTVSNLKVTVHRLRQRFRELLRAEVARTAATPEEVEEEICDLYATLKQ